MRVLWIVNIPLPQIASYLGIKNIVGGGWMESMAKKLVETNGKIELAIACCAADRYVCKKIDGIIYYVLPVQKCTTQYDKSLEKYWKTVTTEFNPDVIHIHGTEFAHSLSYLKVCGNARVCVSIQGLISIIAEYYRANIPIWDFYSTITLRTLIGRDNMWQGKRDFIKRGRIEKEILKRVKYVIGRTEWDKTHVHAINSEVKYFHCNETLRSIFYKYKWDYNKCEKHTIFLSQSSYPIKGLHQVIKAVALVKNKYPDVKVSVAGVNILKNTNLKENFTISGYGRYIKKLLKKFNLQNNILFLGPLSEKQMCNEYLRCNLFILPSSIENSPNSLCEAQILGTPCISSYVGGTPEFMTGAEKWMYRFEEYKMLASKIENVFFETNVKFRVEENENLRKQAILRHSSESNCMTLINIYKQISSINNED